MTENAEAPRTPGDGAGPTEATGPARAGTDDAPATRPHTAEAPHLLPEQGREQRPGPGQAQEREQARSAQAPAHGSGPGGPPDEDRQRAVPLASVTGARQHLAVLLPVSLTGTPTGPGSGPPGGGEHAPREHGIRPGRTRARGTGPAEVSASTGRRDPGIAAWAEGPMPFTNGSRVTDAATRSGYFTPAAARALYGRPHSPRRWHSPTRVTHGPLRLDGMELLRTATERRPRQGLAVLHLTVHGPHLLETLRRIARRGPSPSDALTGPLDPARLLAGVAEVRLTDAPFALERPYTVAFFTPTDDPAQSPACRPTPDTPVPASADRWLRQLTVRAGEQDLPLAPETAATLPRNVLRISTDWSALVLRSGTAFLGHRPDQGQGDYFAFAAQHARTVHLDAILLGTVQRDHIEEIADELSEVFDNPRITERVNALERRIAHFRSTHWRHNLTIHGPANDVLLAFHEQNRLPERFAEILAATGDLARIAQTQESQQISGALGLLTVLGLPLGTALGILQVLGDESATHLVVALVAAVVATAAALTTSYGRLVLNSLRTTLRKH